jgi:hypothetical protein
MCLGLTVQASAAEVWFGQVRHLIFANPELDQWSGSGKMAEPQTGCLQTRSQEFSPGSEWVRTFKPLFQLPEENNNIVLYK